MATPRASSLRKRASPSAPPAKEAPPRLRCVGCPLSLARQPYAELVGGRVTTAAAYDCAHTLCISCFSSAQCERSAGVEVTCPKCDLVAGGWRIHPFKFSTKKPSDADRPPPVHHKIRVPSTEEDVSKLERVLKLAQMCKLAGCEAKKTSDGGGYCEGHAGIGLRLAAPVAAAADAAALKPVHEANDRIYAAYWQPEDMDREAAPVWHPGLVTHRRELEDDPAADEKYGKTSRYNVTYDLGDRLRGLEERYVCAAEDHELRRRLGVLNAGGGRNASAASWRGVKGVRNVTDKNSSDPWAKHVGWYVATVDGEKHEFASLKDALRAVDAATLRRKGLLAREDDLHLPEEWPELFRKEEEKEAEVEVEEKTHDASEEGRSDGAGGEDKEDEDQRPTGPPAKRRREGGSATGQAAGTTPAGGAEVRKKQPECKTVGCTRARVKKFDFYCRKCYGEHCPEAFEAVLAREKERREEKKARKEAQEMAERAREKAAREAMEREAQEARKREAREAMEREIREATEKEARAAGVASDAGGISDGEADVASESDGISDGKADVASDVKDRVMPDADWLLDGEAYERAREEEYDSDSASDYSSQASDGEAAPSVDAWLAALPPQDVLKLSLSFPPLKSGRVGVTLREDARTFGLPMIAALAQDSPLRDAIPPYVVHNYCVVSIAGVAGEGDEAGVVEIRSVADFTRELRARRKEEGESPQEVWLVARRGFRPPQSTGPLSI